MFGKFDAAFIDSLDLMQDVPDSTREEMVEVGLSPMKSRETAELNKRLPRETRVAFGNGNKATKAKKKQREERMQLKRMAVAAVRRRVRLEGGDEAEEVQVEGGEMEGW